MKIENINAAEKAAREFLVRVKDLKAQDVSKNDAAVKELVEAAKQMVKATMTCGDTDDADVYASRREVEKAIKKMEGL